MFQFFVGPEDISEGMVSVTGSDVNHMKNALRMRAGERVRVSDNAGQDFLCEIASIEEALVTLRILAPCQGTELPVQVTLFQGLPKGDKMEWAIQKSIELGVTEIIPVAMRNCVVKLDEKKAEAKRKRWQAIAESAAKQSKRSIIPQVGRVRSFQEAMELSQTLDVRIFPYEQERGMAHTREVFQSIEAGSSIGIFIGPEGGFSAEEVELAKEEMEKGGLYVVSLGNRILRTETAGAAALAMLAYALED
ncbi:16S rRNA (uracil(1498)-N(3))-methyltransferase [Lachnospiraceae bacterium 29-84]